MNEDSVRMHQTACSNTSSKGTLAAWRKHIEEMQEMAEIEDMSYEQWIDKVKQLLAEQDLDNLDIEVLQEIRSSFYCAQSAKARPK